MQMTRWEIRLGDALYPAALLDLEEPPKRLYGRGDPTVMSATRCISIVGARRPTPYGLAVAEMAGRVSAECGITVVSGGAMGCDSAALRSAVKAGGRTIVVPGTGADVCYPQSSRDVFESAVATGGCVVAIESWGSQPKRWTFPKRNKIIAALSQALIVTEAGERSGTYSTADAAADMGRNVYAVPGSIFSPESRGANRLIGSGASIISSEEDLEVRISLDYGAGRLLAQGPDREHGRILSALFANPMRPDDLANRLGMSSTDMIRMLSDYEMSGLAVRLPDGRWAPSRDAYLRQDGDTQRGRG